jgi:hypothetical protein
MGDRKCREGVRHGEMHQGRHTRKSSL